MLQSAYRAFHLMATAMTKVVNDLLTASDSGHPSVLLSLEWTLAQLSTCSTMIACLRIWSQQSSSRLAELMLGRSTYIRVIVRMSLFHYTLCNRRSSGFGASPTVVFFVHYSRRTTNLILRCIFYHQYADDTQLYTVFNPISVSDLQRLSYCADAVTTWHLVNGPLLNPSKTESLVVGTRSQVSKYDSTAGLHLVDTTVEISKAIRAFGIIIDRHPIFDEHITKVVSSCNYHIQSLRQIRHVIDRDTANTIACPVVATRLDYYNAVLHDVTGKSTSRLQRVQNSLARDVCAAHYHSPSVPLYASCTAASSQTQDYLQH